MLVVNYLANALPINNKTTGEISAEYENLFVPAGITFSIWGIIYLMLIFFCVLQFKTENKEIVNSIGWFFIISCILNSMWIFAWHFQNLPISLLIMLSLLISLIIINIKLVDAPTGITKAAFGIYLGWICIATIANISAFLTDINWSGFGISGEIWAVIVICVGLIITSIAAFKFQNPFIAISVIWAFAGIAIKQSSGVQSIFISAVAAGIISVIIMSTLFYKRFS
jgi:hypothetical protein